MDKNFRLFGKVSIVDIGLIALVVVSIALILRFALPTITGSKGGETKIRYTIEMSSKKLGFADNIVVGEKLYDAAKGYEIGTIVNKYTEPEKVLVSDSDAKIFRESVVDDLERVYFVVETTALVTEESTVVSGEYEVLVGKAVYIKSKDFASGGYIVILEHLM